MIMPRSNAHYSAGVIHDGLLYVSGQLSVDPSTGMCPDGGIVAETMQALKNLDSVLLEAGTDRSKVLQCRIYTPDIAYWDAINTVYAEYFGTHMPARAIVPTGPLHHGCLVEIEAVAFVGTAAE